VSFSFIIVASLYAFDRSAQKPVGAMLSAARGTAEEAWLNTVKKAVGLWILLDRIYLGFTILLTVSLGLVSYGTLDHFRLSMKEPLTIPEILNFILWGAQILSIGLFVVSFSLDYGRNVSFYSGRRANVNHENEGGHRI
jgi:hypothetical protein